MSWDAVMFEARLLDLCDGMGIRGDTLSRDASHALYAAYRRLGPMRRVLERVNRLLSSQGRPTEDGYFFRGVLDPELGELARAVRVALDVTEDDE